MKSKPMVTVTCVLFQDGTVHLKSWVDDEVSAGAAATLVVGLIAKAQANYSEHSFQRRLPLPTQEPGG